jgi:hypothetical protein
LITPPRTAAELFWAFSNMHLHAAVAHLLTYITTDNTHSDSVAPRSMPMPQSYPVGGRAASSTGRTPPRAAGTLSPSVSSTRSATPTRSTRSRENDLRALELSESCVDSRPSLSRPGRSDTITSLGGFDFRDGLLPLTLSGEGQEAQATAHTEEKHVGMLHGMALVVGMQVGSGIFSSPGVVVAEVGSPGASLLVWVLSGLLAWTGAR